MSMELKELPLSMIVVDEDQPRKEFDIEELKMSVREHGILVPIIVQPNPSGDEMSYMILDGERRYRSAKSLGLETIPAVINTSRVKDRFRDQVVIDHQRHSLTVEEKSAAWTSLLEQYNGSYEEVARVVGVSVSQVKNVIEGVQFKARVGDQLPDDLGYRERAVIRRTNRIKDDNLRARLIVATIENKDSNKLIDAKVKILSNRMLDNKKLSMSEQNIILNAKDIEEALISIRNMREEAEREAKKKATLEAEGFRPVRNLEIKDKYACPYCEGEMRKELHIPLEIPPSKLERVTPYICRSCASLFLLKGREAG